MTYSEFYEKCTPYHAYSGWVSVETAKALGYIPEKYWEYFSDKCECGSDNVISSDLKQEMCCDPRCRVKAAYGLAEMFSRLGVKGLGPASCKRIYTAMRREDERLRGAGKEGLFQSNSYVEVLLVPWNKYPRELVGLSVASDFYSACCMVLQKSMTFPQMVGALGLTSIGSNADKIFEGVNSFREWKQEVSKAGSLLNYCVGRGISSLQMIYNISNSVEDILVADFAWGSSLRKVGLNKINVCITGRVQVGGEWCTKAAFIEKCNRVGCDSAGVQLIEVTQTTAKASVPFIIYTTPEPQHEKFRTGLQRGIVRDQFGEHSVLMTADNFYRWLEGVIAEWNSQLNQISEQNGEMMNSWSLETLMQEQLRLYQRNQLEMLNSF